MQANKFSFILNNFLLKIGNGNFYEKLIKIWNVILDKFSNRTKIKNLDKEILYVYVSDSRILNELRLLSPIILEKMETFFEKEKLDKTFFKVNSIKFIYNNKI